jgi:hypothetical protein
MSGARGARAYAGLTLGTRVSYTRCAKVVTTHVKPGSLHHHSDSISLALVWHGP